MLGYISSTRKKSCSACVKAKRRCDLGYPCCKRCLTRDLDCQYPNPTVLDAEVIIRQSTPDFAPLTADVDVARPTAAASSLPFPFGLSVPDNNEPRLYQQGLPQIWTPIFLNPDQVVFVVRRLCAIVPSIAYSGSTSFLHPALYQPDSQPTAYHDTCSLSALYLMRTPQTTPILLNAIGTKISALEATSASWSLTDHLAAVQALIIYQIIRLFDASLNAQAQAVKHNGLLADWTSRLWRRSFMEPNTFANDYDAWVFFESLRRTVLMSLFVRCAWDCATNGGLSNQILQLIRFPLTRDSRLWECNSADWVQRADLTVREDQFLTSYDELADNYSFAQPLNQVSEMERLLLGACVGDEDPRLLSDSDEHDVVPFEAG